METAGQRVLLAGAGLGGLAAAVALRQRGFDVRLFERDEHPEAREQGFVVNLEGGLEALDTLGLGDAVRAAGVPTPALHLLDAAGGRLFTFPSRGAFSIARSRLRQLLLAAAGPETVSWGDRCSGYREAAGEDREGGVELSFVGGGCKAGTLLVGCDGVRSAVREQLVGDGLVYLGVTIVGGEVRGEGAALAGRSGALSGGKFMTLSERGSFYSTPMVAGRRIRWSVGLRSPRDEVEERFPEPAQLKEELLRRLGSCHDPIPKMIEATPASRIRTRPVLDRDPLRRFASEAVTLLGDSAHPMSPYRGLGANLALLDAVDLARELAEGETAAAALAAYQRILLERGRRAQRVSRQAARLLHFDHPFPSALRNGFLRLGHRLVARRAHRAPAPPQARGPGGGRPVAGGAARGR